ncbi:hypothetical protein GGX14DRAFT_409242 [Mycena pura]|uniref:Uncharacterized protein n=1 Tax=Mycena pura TaxID=153505 RepID=A0AAD6UMK8_9AGAR|nr:hypothetical protein GGX14DRAFT_409242 [Mycena pura]
MPSGSNILLSLLAPELGACLVVTMSIHAVAPEPPPRSHLRGGPESAVITAPARASRLYLLTQPGVRRPDVPDCCICARICWPELENSLLGEIHYADEVHVGDVTVCLLTLKNNPHRFYMMDPGRIERAIDPSGYTPLMVETLKYLYGLKASGADCAADPTTWLLEYLAQLLVWESLAIHPSETASVLLPGLRVDVDVRRTREYAGGAGSPADSLPAEPSRRTWLNVLRLVPHWHLPVWAFWVTQLKMGGFGLKETRDSTIGLGHPGRLRVRDARVKGDGQCEPGES